MLKRTSAQTLPQRWFHVHKQYKTTGYLPDTVSVQQSGAKCTIAYHVIGYVVSPEIA